MQDKKGTIEDYIYTLRRKNLSSNNRALQLLHKEKVDVQETIRQYYAQRDNKQRDIDALNIKIEEEQNKLTELNHAIDSINNNPAF